MSNNNMASNYNNKSDAVVLDEVKSISSVTCHKAYDDTTRHCSNNVVQGLVLSSSPMTSSLTSSLTSLSSEQSGLIEEQIKESEEISIIANPAPVTSESRVISIETCRICLDASRKETLISPCECLGSLAFVHLSCLERWLGASKRESCEICRHNYLTELEEQPFVNWLRIRSSQWNLLFCLLFLLIFTALFGGLMSLVVMKSIRTFRIVGFDGLVCLLVLVSLVLIYLYIVWCVTVCVSLYEEFRTWQKVHPIVKIVNLRPQPTSPVVTTSDHHASLPTSVINVCGPSNNRRRPPTMGHNRVQPSWNELDDENTLIGDTTVITDTEDPMRLTVEPTTGDDSLLTPDTSDVMMEQDYSCSPSLPLSPKDSDGQNQPVIETQEEEEESTVVPL